MDEADITAAREEFNHGLYLAASRKPEGPQPTGRCLCCDEIVGDTMRWCNALCRDAWSRE